MSFWDEILAVLRALVRTEPQPMPDPEPPPGLQPRVLVINFNPMIEAEGGNPA